MKKRILSLLLAALMLVGLVPMSTFAAGSPVVNIPDTTGTGLSAEDPIVCNSFAELKAVLEYDGTVYVRLESGTGFDEVLPEPSSSSDNAITMIGTKYLELQGFGKYDSRGSTKYNAFMQINGALTISGNGGITYKHNSRFGDGAVLLLNNADASLTIKDNPSITADLNMNQSDDEHWAFSRAIAATGGTLTVNGGSFYGTVFDGPGVQSYMHRSAVYVGGSVEATIKGGKFVCSRIYSSSSPLDSHPVGMTFAPYSARNITLVGGTFKGMYITGTEKELNAYLPQGYYYYDVNENTRFVGNEKESPRDQYETSTDVYHDIQIIDVTEGVLNFGIQTPNPTNAEKAVGKTDLGTLYIGTNQVNKTFSVTAARLPDRELAAGFTTKLRTEVFRDGELIYSAENGDAINLSSFMVDNSYIGKYQVRHTILMWDVLTNTSRNSDTHTYTMQVKNVPIGMVRVNITEPRPGQMPEEVSLLTQKVDRLTAVWYEVGENGSLTRISADETFKNNTTYRVSVSAYAKDIHDFDASTSATINGLSATVEYADGDMIRFYRDYNTGDGVLTSIAVTTPPTKTAYKEGDTLQVAGMVVMGYFSNNYSRELTLGTEYVVVESSKMAEGQTYITVSATIGGVTKTATTPVTVSPANYAFTFLEEAPLTFDLPIGTTPTAKTLTVQNIGDQKLGVSDIALSGANPEAFVLSREQLWPMFATGTNSQRDFTVAPAENLAEGVYTATVTVTNVDAEISISMELILNVYDPVMISGTITSYGSEEDEILVGLYQDGDFTYQYQATLTGNEAAYTFDGLVPGDYILEVSKKGHTTAKIAIDDLTEDTVVDVELEATVPVTGIELEMNGYELAKPFDLLGIWPCQDGASVEGHLVLDENGNVMNNAYAEAEKVYALLVYVKPHDGYDFNGLTAEACTLNGITCAEFTADADGLWLAFPLPMLDAVSIEDICFETNSYGVGDDYDVLYVYSDTEGVEALESNVIDDRFAVLEGIFEYNTPYLVEVFFVVAGGCDLAVADMSHITLDGVSAMQLYELGENTYAAVFYMPGFKVQHEVTFMIGDSFAETQYVNDGEAVTEPEEPYMDGYKFIGWHTDADELYDFSTPVTAPITLTAKFVPAHVVTLMFGDTPVGWLTVEHGKTVEKPEDPAQEGMTFVGWVTPDGELYDFNEPVYSDMSLTAKFETSAMLGDLNFDGTVNMMDALLLYGGTGGARTMTEEQTAVSDMNSDGTVNMMDALLLYKLASGA
ncbi:MAG: InlB B-repeat-containing protein [Clostridia bacterium]|nr:InlB B-repeat-containing protein [Clostridia bacterium]